MKGVILAGGLGTRLHPLTKVTNKCLLPVYDKPMIYHPINSMVESGIKDILIVCGGNAAGEFLRILGNGEDFGLKHLHYTYQSEPRGIADALSLAQDWADNSPIAVVLADNLFENHFGDAVSDFEGDPTGARIFVTKVKNPQHYGVVDFDAKGNVTSIEEKPKNPKTNSVATGLYMYDSSVWNLITSLSPSSRNELEITDLNNMYLKLKMLKAIKVKGWWMDAGENIDGYMEACAKVGEMSRNRKKKK
jgi:glucose-1-phosphate thymidylyltransferase